MKLIVDCPQCVSNGMSDYDSKDIEITDDGIYKIKCRYGHECLVFLMHEKFVILFDMGAMALLDGYSREAISSFASSLERFYEYCIKVFLLKNKINEYEYEKTWKYVSNQSERQLGAFYFLYLSTFGKAPLCLDNKQVEFRNKVIHKGYIPNYNEVVKYADSVLKYILQIIKELKMYSQEEMHLVSQNRISKTQNQLSSKDGKALDLSFMGISTIIDLLSSDISCEGNFEEALDKIKSYNEVIYAKY